jgi:aminoglycoside phosphotransferase (APT) family kinase protein
VIDTIPVRTDEQFSVRRVEDFLRSSGFDVADLEVEQFPAGHSNLTYLLRSAGWEAVLRRPPLGPVAPRAHDMPREFQILRRLHPLFPLAPQAYLVCEDPAIIGAPFYVMERRRGLVLDQELPSGWAPDAALFTDITQSLVRVLVDLHAVDWKTAGLGEISHPEGYMRRQVSGWIERYQRSRTDDLPPFDRLFDWLSAELPKSPPDPTMIHNDYKLNNVLLDAQNPRRVTAVLDWEMATVGDPLSDVASLLVYWTEPGEADIMGGLKSVTGTAGFPSRDDVAQAYARVSGRDLSALQWYVAFAYFKVGVICQQIYFRWRNGQTHDQRFAGHGTVAGNLLRRAEEEASLG